MLVKPVFRTSLYTKLVTLNLTLGSMSMSTNDLHFCLSTKWKFLWPWLSSMWRLSYDLHLCLSTKWKFFWWPWLSSMWRLSYDIQTRPRHWITKSNVEVVIWHSLKVMTLVYQQRPWTSLLRLTYDLDLIVVVFVQWHRHWPYTYGKWR